MSRLEKKTVLIPSDIKFQVQKDKIDVQGPKGKLSCKVADFLNVELKDNKIKIKGDFALKTTREHTGLVFALINNMMLGVTQGFKKELEIVGVGYRVQIEGKNIKLQIGFSHPVIFPIPEGLEVKAPKPNQILIEGIDKQKVGDTAARIRALYPPEPYKGKGIRYKGEFVRRKLGKAATK